MSSAKKVVNQGGRKQGTDASKSPEVKALFLEVSSGIKSLKRAGDFTTDDLQFEAKKILTEKERELRLNLNVHLKAIESEFTKKITKLKAKMQEKKIPHLDMTTEQRDIHFSIKETSTSEELDQMLSFFQYEINRVYFLQTKLELDDINTNKIIMNAHSHMETDRKKKLFRIISARLPI